MKSISVFLIVAAFALGFWGHAFLFEDSSPGWTSALQTRPDGSIISGSKENLIDALRNGYNLKLAWGWQDEDKKLEHLAVPIWLAIVNEKEVIAHLDPQVLSRIDWSTSTANYQDSTLHDLEWRVVISTDGSFDAVWYNRRRNQIHRRVPQKHIMNWMIDYPNKATRKPKPIFEEIK